MSLPPLATSAEELERFENALPMARRMAKRFYRSLGGRFELDDLESAARQGLWDAAKRFDPARKIPFLGYAHLRVKGDIIKEIRANSKLSEGAFHRALALQMAANAGASEIGAAALEVAALEKTEAQSAGEAEKSLDKLMATFATAVAVGLMSESIETDQSTDSDLEEEYHQHELLAIVRDEIKDLDDREAKVVTGMYFQQRTIDDMALEFDCDRSWVSRVHSKAVGRLRKRLSRVAAE